MGDALTTGLVMLGFTVLIGLIVWLVKGRLDKSDVDMAKLKESVVYEDTCQANRQAQAQGVAQIKTTLNEIQVDLKRRDRMLNAMVTDIAVIKASVMQGKQPQGGGE